MSPEAIDAGFAGFTLGIFVSVIVCAVMDILDKVKQKQKEIVPYWEILARTALRDELLRLSESEAEKDKKLLTDGVKLYEHSKKIIYAFAVNNFHINKERVDKIIYEEMKKVLYLP